MAFQILDAEGVLRTITAGSIQDGATLRPLRAIQIMDGATLRTVASFVAPMTVAASPTEVIGTDTGSTVTSQSATVTPTGGGAPYTYAWVRNTGSATINSPTSATTTFTETGLAVSELRTSTFTCTVTDASGQTATANVTAFIDRVSGA